MVNKLFLLSFFSFSDFKNIHYHVGGICQCWGYRKNHFRSLFPTPEGLRFTWVGGKETTNQKRFEELPWRSSGGDSVLPLQGGAGSISGPGTRTPRATWVAKENGGGWGLSPTGAWHQGTGAPLAQGARKRSQRSVRSFSLSPLSLSTRPHEIMKLDFKIRPAHLKSDLPI